MSEPEPRGPVSIVPAPYRRNLERLARALDSAHACIRLDGAGITGEADTTPTKLTAEKLARGHLWTLRCGSHDLDVEGHAPGVPTYQERRVRGHEVRAGRRRHRRSRLARGHRALRARAANRGGAGDPDRPRYRLAVAARLPERLLAAVGAAARMNSRSQSRLR